MYPSTVKYSQNVIDHASHCHLSTGLMPNVSHRYSTGTAYNLKSVLIFQSLAKKAKKKQTLPSPSDGKKYVSRSKRRYGRLLSCFTLDSFIHFGVALEFVSSRKMDFSQVAKGRAVATTLSRGNGNFAPYEVKRWRNLRHESCKRFWIFQSSVYGNCGIRIGFFHNFPFPPPKPNFITSRWCYEGRNCASPNEAQPTCWVRHCTSL